jgi:MarR family transcriptional regulator, negative regulator of the multidrug operon emrRAB
MTHAFESRALNLVGAFALAVADRVSAGMDELGAPAGSAAAALLLIHHGHVRRIDDLRAPLALTQAGVVRLVDRLAAAGLVKRVPGAAADRRKVSLVLTRSGARRARELLRARERAMSELLADLAPDQVTELGAVCERVLATIAADAPAPARLCRHCDEQACDLTLCPVELAHTNEGGKTP